MMKLLANENFPKASVLFLRSVGYDVLSIAEDHFSISDSSVMEIAKLEERLILTFDRDYGELILRHGYLPEKGVIFLRLFNFSPVFPGEFVHHVLSVFKIDTNRKFTVCTKENIRQRSY